MSGSVIHLCIPKEYKFCGISFEVSVMGMPWPLKKNGEPMARAGRVFFAKIKPWLDMTKEAQEHYRVGGGCGVAHV